MASRKENKMASYEIRPESLSSFIDDETVKLPRFQRKLTWNEKKNFKLCISIFKNYPIGVVILSSEKINNRTVKWLLDGRQRRNVLLQMYEDPENIYDWGRKFIGFRNNQQPYEIETMFWNKIKEYIELEDEEELNESERQVDEVMEGDDESASSNAAAIDGDDEYNRATGLNNEATGLAFLLEIIKIMHNKNKRGSGFTKPFDFVNCVEKTSFAEKKEGNTKLSSKKLKTFLDEYRTFCKDNDCNYEDQKSFYDFVDERCTVKDKKTFQEHLKTQWKNMLDRIEIIARIFEILQQSKIGCIEVEDLSPADAQKIFNIINQEGEKLKAVEVYSAKPSWNMKIENPSEEMKISVKKLYDKIGTTYKDIVKWDLPATLLKRIGKNFIVSDAEYNAPSQKNAEFAQELTKGFKILAGIWARGVKSENIELLSSKNINWGEDYEKLIAELKEMVSLIKTSTYFKYFTSWNVTIEKITSETVAINFLIISYLDWTRKGQPTGSNSKAKQFQKNCFILLDKLIHQYVSSLWRGSGDSKIATNIATLESESDLFSSISPEEWLRVLEEIRDKFQISRNNISLETMKPILYHFYCLKQISSPPTEYQIEVDHIIPKELFKNAANVSDSELSQKSLFNLGLLPKAENGSKSNKRLNEITDQWLKDYIKMYEFIEEKDYEKYSDVSNYQEMYQQRFEIFKEAIYKEREWYLNN